MKVSDLATIQALKAAERRAALHLGSYSPQVLALGQMLDNAARDRIAREEPASIEPMVKASIIRPVEREGSGTQRAIAAAAQGLPITQDAPAFRAAVVAEKAASAAEIARSTAKLQTATEAHREKMRTDHAAAVARKKRTESEKEKPRGVLGR